MAANQERREDEAEVELPNVADPLSEPTLNRRVWAAYLQRKYTRKSFAEAMETTYAVVHGWDHGSPGRAMSLGKLQRASRLLGYTMDELCFGKQALIGRAEPVLDAAGIREALSEVNADIPTRAAFADHLTKEGKFQEITRTYVHLWVSIHRQLRERGVSPEVAAAAALIEAVQGQAIAAAVAGTQPELRDLSVPAARLSPEYTDALRQVMPAAALAKVKPVPSRRR